MSDGGTGGSGDGGTGDGGTGGSDGGSSDGGSGGSDGGSSDGGSGSSDGGSGGSDGGSGGPDGGSGGGGSDGGTGGGGGGGGGGGDCKCSNGVCTYPNGSTCLDLKVVPVIRETGEIASTPALIISTPRPVIQIQWASLTVEGLAPSPYGLNGYLSIQGYVFSGVADTTPGATIDNVRLYVQGRPEPIVLPLQVFKNSGGALGAPYPYYGILQAFVPIDGLLPDTMGNAWVNFRIEASDPIGHGVGEASFTVDLAPMDLDLFPQELYAQTPEPNFHDWNDDTHPSVIRVTGPEKLLSSQGFTVETFDGQRGVIKWDDGQYYIATREGDRPEVMLAVPNEYGNEGDWLDDSGGHGPPGDPYDGVGAGVLKRSGASAGRAPAGPAAWGWDGSGWFLAGFVVGFGEGGVDLVKGTVKVAVAIPRSVVEGTWALITHPWSTMQEAWDQGWAAANFIREAGWTVIQIGTRGADFLRKVVAGDPEALQVGDATMRAALQMTGELIAEAWNDYMLLVEREPYEAGKIFGRGMFEVAALVAPWAKAGQLSNISKLRFLESLQAEIAAGKIAIFRSARVQQKLGKLILWTQQLIRLCFPAGTPVLTPDGPVPIERIKAGDRVISRDPITGQQTARTVLDTVSTMPTRLFHVRYRLTEPVVAPEARWAGTVAHRSRAGGDSADDGEPPAEIVSTGTHPFWVVQKQAFVEAEQLVPGDLLRLASGGTAEIFGVEPEDAAPGKHFVTYNLEVEEFHTYFAGADALWVHNYGFSCEKFVALLQDTETWIRNTFGVADIHPWDLFQMTFQRNFGVKKPGKVNMDPDDIKKLLREYAVLYPNHPPRTVRYRDWENREAWLKTKFDNTQIQGNHWWPKKDLGEGVLAGGADGEGAVFPLATPYLHTGGPHGIHVQMHEFFKEHFGVRTMDEVKDRFADLGGTGQELFDAQQALLKRFWKERFSLDMPTFQYMPDRADLNYGRGVFSGIKK
ncbi:MAG: hypothetical protein EHM78_19765 [Myxococcaceae bacterium]|nr:MAG: hypothetical protein EHM78_19765 [Myxococcaceae bacterium]